MSSPLQAITEQLANHLGGPLHYQGEHSLFGGDINQTFLLKTDQGPFFLKLNKVNRLTMFEAEFAALEEIARSRTIRVPSPILAGTTETHAFLAMEYIELGGSSDRAEAALGEQLAAMHQCTATQFGWDQDNTIGSTPQQNQQHDHWIDFWREQRIAPQLRWANHSSLNRKGEQLLNHLDTMLADHQPTPSLLHGDLWGGNWSTARSGEPVLYDPALYYGDRETDLAMTTLFGGFSPRFYEAYQTTWPLDAGYEQRIPLYNLYHILNHYNLFGGGYGRQAEQIIDRLLKAL